MVPSLLNSPGEESAFSGICEITKHMSCCLSEIKKMTAARFYSFQSELKAPKATKTWPKVRG